MNTSIYRLVWNHSLGALQVVSELARSRACGASIKVRGAMGSVVSLRPSYRMAWPLALIAIGVANSASAAVTGTTGGDGSVGVIGAAGTDAVTNDATAGQTGGSGGTGSDGGLGASTSGSADSNADAVTGGLGGNGGAGNSGGQGGNADGTDGTQQQSAAGGAGGAGGSAGLGGTGQQVLGSAFANSGSLTGGNGGVGGIGGTGGTGGYIGLYSSYTGLTPGAFATGAGGVGGLGGAGASAGAGVVANASLISNSGAIAGGSGGAGGTGGTGGIGGNAGVEDSNYTGTATGSSFVGGNGGSGGAGGLGGSGGTGVSATDSTLFNGASVMGGAGGTGGTGGAGGNADSSYYSTEISSALPYTVTSLSGSGGAGGAGGSGGVGGSGIDVSNTLVVNSAAIIGGTGAAGGTGGNGGDAQGAQFFSVYPTGAAGSVVTSTTGSGGNGGNGGNGGDGGSAVVADHSTLLNSGSVVGGNGGNGGTGGNGGSGGYAEVNNAAAFTGSSTTDGNGGTGGNAGNGGNGGAAITASAATLVNTGSIVGGNGGAAGAAGTGGLASTLSTQLNSTYTAGSDGLAGTAGSAGAGGVGISGTGNTTVYNAGVIAGGYADGGSGAQANAIEFTGGGNKLVLEQGSTIQGNVVSLGGGDTLALGGDASSAGGEVFDLASAGVQYQGFDTYSKEGQSTWLLQGVDSLGETWNVNAGTLALDQNTALLGGVNVNAGTFALSQGALVAGDVTVASGANLEASTAAIGGALLNQGNVSLESGTGTPNTLTTGSFSQTGSGTLTLSALSSLMFDKLVVNGTATLAGTLAVDAKSGNTVAIGNGLNTVITASAISGQFATVTDNSLLFNFTPVYTANSVSLNVVSAASSSAGNTTNPTTTVDTVQASGNTAGLGAAQALDQTFSTTPGGRLASYFVPLTTTAEVSRAVSQTLPTPNASTGAATTALTSINQVVQARSDSVRGLSSGEGFINDGHLWFKPFGSWARQSGTGGTADMKASIGGLAIGADGKRTDNLTLGAAFVYAKVDSHNTGNAPRQSLETDVFQLVGYGSYQLDPITALNFQVDAGQNRNDGKRDISFAGLQARSHYSSWTAHAGTSLDRTYTLKPGTRFIPSVRADYTWIKDEAYNEKGADALNLQANKRTTDSFVLGVDGKLAHDFNDRVTASVSAGVGYDFLADRNSITTAYAGAPTAAFTTYGNDAQHWIGRGGAGVSYKVNDRVQVGVRYDLELRKNFNNQTASAELRWAF